MFKLLSGRNFEADRALFESMHRLRYRVFVEELKWPVGRGLFVENQMEFDQFDTEDAFYIVRINEAGEVDACTRLIPTNVPYLLGDVFTEYVETQPVPRSSSIWETSRFCADRRTAPRNIVGQLVAAMLEFGLEMDMTNYVSISDVRIEPLLVRCGWQPTRLGEPRFTGTDYAAGEIFEVSPEALAQVRLKSKINDTLLTENSPMVPMPHPVAGMPNYEGRA
ncbi:acyl-homoserine-lactone synthase [Hoeflea sp. EC-HK425]|uniref:acyl-homoserine-lactone synthase n=1 Tax=Hoeflea sp. EC-HK425 TaxID=2038388 RepID=UPI0012590138|nr:acyl-homoserine-lactone synthase [Hoeflea sp. EC-HK425]VVT12235.1 Acyl-homoserine-lactone synthase [Hoeflea sp. EC-HK425]